VVNRLVFGLAGALGLALVVIAFLLGRESQRGAATPREVASATVPAMPSATATEAPSAASPLPAMSAVPIAPVPQQASAATATPAATFPNVLEATPVPADQDQRGAVARYFADVDALQAGAAQSGDPEAMAQAIVKQATEGNSDALDALLASNRRVLEGLRGVSAPPACAPHREKAVRLLEDGISLLESVKNAFRSGGQDVGALGALTAKGQEIERGAKDADALAAAIKKHYGL
jgi:hypothetical protein